jgi:hypothetical protein
MHSCNLIGDINAVGFFTVVHPLAAVDHQKKSLSLRMGPSMVDNLLGFLRAISIKVSFRKKLSVLDNIGAFWLDTVRANRKSPNNSSFGDKLLSKDSVAMERAWTCVCLDTERH